MLVTSGWNRNSLLENISLLTGIRITAGKIKTGRYGHAASISTGRGVLVTGGLNDEALNSAQVYLCLAEIIG